jgi:hypothetical protein
MESSRPFQHHRIQPEFGYHALASHMNMGRFIAIEGDKEIRYAPNLNTVGICLPLGFYPHAEVTFNPSPPKPVQVSPDLAG